MSLRRDELIEKGCMQVSRKYRLVGFMPAGYGTALEALAALQPEVAAGLMRRYAASLEAHAKQEVCSTNTVELTPEEFNEYLSKTGRKPVALAPEDGKGCELCRTYTNNHRKDCPNAPPR
jgi:hypothetical protein